MKTRKSPRPKALWYLVKHGKPKPRERKRVRPVSKSREKRLAEYRKVRAQFLVTHTHCQFPILAACKNRVEDVHHSRGRVGSLLTDTRYFFALCRSCHNWVAANPEAARERGLICAKGLWNTPPKDA